MVRKQEGAEDTGRRRVRSEERQKGGKVTARTCL